MLIRCDHVLPQLFGRVLTAPAVIQELLHPLSPAAVRAWAEWPPSWLEVQSPSFVDPTIRLGPGETQAISLARDVKANLVLIDERKATRVALGMGFLVTGTLGVLIAASQKGLIRLSEALDALPATFRAPESLLRELRGRTDQASLGIARNALIDPPG